MVGLSDIPCVGKIVDRISDATVDPVFRGFNYMFCYKDHVNVLNFEIEKVNNQEVSVSSKAVAAKADGKIIYDHVLKWQKDVEQFQESAKEFLEKYNRRSSWRCIQCLPIPKPVSRFQLGREAVHKAKRVTELYDSAKDLLANDVAYLPPVANVPATVTLFQGFESRKDAYEKLWEALVNDGGPIILGIYGMPGVGKTRMMEQIWQEAKEKNIFDMVARADVGSEELDVIKLQNQIAGHLNCHFESKDDKMHRANQLKHSFMNGGKILLILDDVWTQIPLHNIIGTSFADGSTSTGSKILVTSREKYVCLDNNCEHPIEITTLTAVEAWDLFKYTVGTDKIDSLQDKSLLQEVCNKCAGLPLLIHAVGKALKCRPHDSWMDALYQLEKGKVEKISGIDQQVYACVKLSIDRLPEDAKSCLFLCSLYSQDAVISIRQLIQVATGTQLVPEGESRVCAMVDILRSSSLLLDCREDHIMKLHDLIRDVARSIAVRDQKYAFSVVKCGSRLPDNADYRTRKLLHLHLEENDFRFSDGLVCPDLHNLWLQCNKHTQKFSGGFFSMFADLRFLLIKGMFSSLELEFSLQPLGKLTTLILKNCNMTCISQVKNVSFFPENLETLCIWDCDLPVPLGLPILKYLRKLEIQGWRGNNMEMVPNTISSMPSLEELHIPNGFNIQDAGSETSINAASAPILTEISKLTRLKSLQMFFMRDSEPFRDTDIFDNLLEYSISVGEARPCGRSLLNSRVSIKRSVQLYGNSLELEGLKGVIERAELLDLSFTHINVGSIYNSNREAFVELKEVYIDGCDTVEYLARISYYEIQHRRSFSKLTDIKIRECSAMKYLFNNSVAKCLVQLQRLSIERCSVMEAIIMNEGTSDGDDDIINFLNLKLLVLSELPRLKSFYRKKEEMQSGSMTNNSAISLLQAPLFDGLVAFPSLENLTLNNAGDATTNIWGKNDSNNNIVSSSFRKLRDLAVWGFDKLETVIPLALLDRLHKLESVDVYDCNRLRNVIQHFSITKDLVHLKKLKVLDCNMMREIIGGADNEQEEEEEITNDDNGIIVLPQLTHVRLNNLPNLKSFWCYQVQLPNLVAFNVFRCGEVNLEAIEMGRDDSNCQLRTLDMTCLNKIRLSCKWQLRLYNLDSLTLRCYHWWHDLKFECFKRLKTLKVNEFGCSALFSFSALECLRQLQILDISECLLLEDIVEDVRGDEASTTNKKKTVALLQLKSVTLRDLPNLKRFFHSANYKYHMPALEKVKVDNCGFSTLFTYPFFRTLKQLKDLRVSNCRTLADIFEDARG